MTRSRSRTENGAGGAGRSAEGRRSTISSRWRACRFRRPSGASPETEPAPRRLHRARRPRAPPCRSRPPTPTTTPSSATSKAAASTQKSSVSASTAAFSIRRPSTKTPPSSASTGAAFRVSSTCARPTARTSNAPRSAATGTFRSGSTPRATVPRCTFLRALLTR